MTVPSPAIDAVDEEWRFTVRFVDGSLRDAAATLHDEASTAAVKVARDVIEDAERSLGRLTTDPWEPTLEPLRRARELLSSHLLAAAVCADADAALLITARVLRRGADAARHAMSDCAIDAGARSTS